MFFNEIYVEDKNIIDTIKQLQNIYDYQHKAAFVADKELNIVACLTEIMGALKFK